MEATNDPRNHDHTIAIGLALRDAVIAWGWALSMAMWTVFWDHSWLQLLAHVFVILVVVGWFLHRLREETRQKPAE